MSKSDKEKWCAEYVHDFTGFHSVRCGYRAKYGQFCGVHAPEKIAERAKKRGPSQSERALARADKRADDMRKLKERVAGLVARVAELEAENKHLSRTIRYDPDLSELRRWDGGRVA